MPRKQNTTNPTALRIKAKRASVSPKRLRQRIAEGEDITGVRAIVRMGELNTRIITGQEDLSLWDDEELARGQRRLRTGGWPGKTPVTVPKQVHDEIVRRVLSKSNMILVEACEDACTAVVDIMLGKYEEGKDDPKAKDRLNAAEVIMNRVMGKEPVRVQVEAFKHKFEEAFEAMLVPDDEDAIDVDSWDDDGDDGIDSD